MTTITPAIRDRLCADLSAASDAGRSGDHARSWDLLEEAHVLSRPWAVWHVRVHGSMLLAAPGSVAGRCPVGNIGRAAVPATRPMPIRDDLADLSREAGR